MKLVRDIETRFTPIVVFLSFLLIYFLSRSSQFDLSDAIAFDEGALFSPNHMLFRPIADVVWKIFQAAGYAGRSVYVLQILNVFFGAIGVTFAFLTFQKLGATSWAAIFGSILLGTSFVHWSQSTDANYLVISGMFCTAALFCAAILLQKPSNLMAFLLGVCFALATLSWQALILLFPVFIWPLRRRFTELIIFAVTTIVILAGFYIPIGILNGKTNLAELFHWMTTHGNRGGGDIPWWGQFNIHRIPLTANSAIQSIQVDAVLWAKGFFRYADPFKALAIGAGAISFALLGVAILFRGVQLAIRKNSKLFWLISGYLCIVTFLVWWEPLDIRNFFVPNIFLCAVATIIVSSWKPTAFTKMVVFGLVTVMAFVTFKFSIWPRHIDRGINMRKADCVHRNMTSKDALISPDWNYSLELLYFYQMRTLGILALSAYFQDHTKMINHIYEETAHAQSTGGKVFIVDPNSYGQDYLKWLAEQTTFTVADFDRFPGKFAFQCEDLKFRKVTSLER